MNRFSVYQNQVDRESMSLYNFLLGVVGLSYSDSILIEKILIREWCYNVHTLKLLIARNDAWNQVPINTLIKMKIQKHIELI